MKADWYFDFISPFSYLQLAHVRALAARVDTAPVPVVLGALLRHHGQLGPAEVRGKREFTYRHVQWIAERDAVPLRFPPAHPFSPIAALRLAIAAGNGWDAIAAIFDHLWKHGRAGDDAASLAEVGRALGIDDVADAISRDEVKAALRTNTEAAIAAGVFGVPTVRIGADLFWGLDATPMVEELVAQPDRFAGAEYRRIATLPRAIERRR